MEAEYEVLEGLLLPRSGDGSVLVEHVEVRRTVLGNTHRAYLEKFLKHIHDEAGLKLRSFDGALGPRAIRGRSSKVQNNCLTHFLGSESIEVASELQPLLRKEGATLGQAILDAVQEALAL